MVQALCLRGRTALVARAADLEDVFVRARPEANLVARTYNLCGLGTLAVHVHLATIHGVRGERAGLEEARRPQPLVYPDRIGPHGSVCVMRGHLFKLTALGASRVRGARRTRLRAAVWGVSAVLVGACGSAERKESARTAERSAIAAGQATAAQAGALPATGLWTEAHLMDRLGRAGVLPRVREGTPPAAPWMARAPIALSAGGGEVYVWIYADSTARRAVTDALDPESGAPPGTVTPFAPPMVFVTNNNLAAIITGGTEQNIERIMLSLQAGLPVAK